jgi:hypothetical protein
MTQTDNLAPQPNAKFWTGQFFATERASHEIGFEQILMALKRHKSGDWGDLCPEDWEANEKALQEGGRLFSVYYDQNGTKFWVITEADRSITTVLMPDDY